MALSSRHNCFFLRILLYSLRPDWLADFRIMLLKKLVYSSHMEYILQNWIDDQKYPTFKRRNNCRREYRWIVTNPAKLVFSLRFYRILKIRNSVNIFCFPSYCALPSLPLSSHITRLRRLRFNELDLDKIFPYI